MYGVTKKGNVKRTDGQTKKHYSQMTATEINFLKKELKEINVHNCKVSSHLVRKFKTELKIELLELARTIKSNDSLIIEYNTVRNDKRILIRSKKEYNVILDGRKQLANICLVISIIENKIVTAYYNSSNDNHNHINMTRYNQNLKII